MPAFIMPIAELSKPFKMHSLRLLIFLPRFDRQLQEFGLELHMCRTGAVELTLTDDHIA